MLFKHFGFGGSPEIPKKAESEDSTEQNKDVDLMSTEPRAVTLEGKEVLKNKLEIELKEIFTELSSNNPTLARMLEKFRSSGRTISQEDAFRVADFMERLAELKDISG